MEHAQDAGVEVLARSRPGGQVAVGEADRHRVDGEVPARQVLLERRAELDRGQRPGPLVALAARAGDVEGELAGADRRGPEALVDDQLPADPLGREACDRRRVALDDEVELARDLPAQRVAHRAPDDVHAGRARDGGEHDVGSGRRAQGIHAVMFH